MSAPHSLAVRPSPEGLVLGDETVPLLSGSMHYFRHARSLWKPGLVELRKLGARFVDVYVPWSVHEVSLGSYDFGGTNPRLDVVAFLETAAELGLHAIVRPGPHVNAELTCFGIPERVIWDPACQAQSPTARAVILPAPPLAFPVPSYASQAFHAEAARWLRAVAEQLGPLAWPHGPVALLQVDNEGSLYFRDGPYDQDYHPDAIAQYRRFLRLKHKSVGALRVAHGDPEVTFESIVAPTRMDAEGPEGLARHLEWAEFQEALLEAAFYRFRKVLSEHGLSAVPSMHNFPIAERATALDPARIGRVCDFVSLDYYHGADEAARREIAFRTSHLSVRRDARRVPAFAAEIGAGFAPNLPPATESDNAFTVLTALAYGLRGFNVYMAVQRDRWIGGPIDDHARPRPSAEFWTRLFSALERTRFHELSRHTPVHIVFPRALDRLSRVCHAYGPIPPVVFSLLGGTDLGATEGASDPTGGAVVRAQGFVRELSGVFDTLRVPHALVQSDLVGHSLEKARWTIVACPGAAAPDLLVAAGQRILAGHAVSFGPCAPERNESFRAMSERLPSLANPKAPLVIGETGEALLTSIAGSVKALDLPRLEVEPVGIHTTLHEDRSGTPRVLFVINAGPEPLEAVAHAPRVRRATDALTGEGVLVTGEHVVLPVGARSVRMLELTS